jgi:Mg-chelatase subunit ChlD
MRRLRLSRTTSGAADPIFCAGQPAIDSASKILAQVGGSVPQLAGFLAEPVVADDRSTIDWYATTSGTAIPLLALQGGDRVAAEERLSFRLDQLRSLGAAAADGPTKALLEAAAHYPGPESVFVVGQEPVLTQWGSRRLSSVAAVLPTARPEMAAAGAGGSRSWWAPALLALVLFLVLLGLLGWLQRDRLVAWFGFGAPPELTTLQPQIDFGLDQAAALEAERLRAAVLRGQVKAMREQFEAKKLACVVPPPEPPPANTPPPEQKSEVTPPAPKPEKKPEKEVKVQPTPVPSAPKPAPPQVAAVPPVPPAPKQACEQAIEERKAWEAPEVVFVIDASGSMGEDAGGETRLSAAKQSVEIIADNLPADVDTALVKFTNCNAIDNDYFLDRASLKRKVNALRPEGGTPLARSIERASNILSRKKDTVMVVVTDGEDSCGKKDPCAVAAAAKASHPNLTINVVDVSGSGAASCIAQNGGGQTLPAHTPAEIKSAMQQATYPHTLPSACKGAP